MRQVKIPEIDGQALRGKRFAHAQIGNGFSPMIPKCGIALLTTTVPSRFLPSLRARPAREDAPGPIPPGGDRQGSPLCRRRSLGVFSAIRCAAAAHFPLHCQRQMTTTTTTTTTMRRTTMSMRRRNRPSLLLLPLPFLLLLLLAALLGGLGRAHGAAIPDGAAFLVHLRLDETTGTLRRIA